MAGTEVSRSAHIRELFKGGLSRGEIAKELAVPYGTVYTATVNMFNDKHPEGGAVKQTKASQIRELVELGLTRGAIAKELGVPYGTVYSATKGTPTENPRRHTVKVGDTDVSRAEYIRTQYKDGKSRREIANELHCDYAVVWAATRKLQLEAAEATDETGLAAEEDFEGFGDLTEFENGSVR